LGHEAKVDCYLEGWWHKKWLQTSLAGAHGHEWRLTKPLNGHFCHTIQDQDDGNGFHLFGCDMEQGFIAIMT
jgi:hypothetical protein